MYPEFTLLNNSLDFIDSNFGGIGNFFGASRGEPAVENCEYNRIEKSFILSVERAVYENISRILNVFSRHAGFVTREFMRRFVLLRLVEPLF